ncbi:MAG: hypothetical protein WCQ41_04860, partial [Bacillota bacterium]
SISINCSSAAKSIITGDPNYDENMNYFGHTSIVVKPSYLSETLLSVSDVDPVTKIGSTLPLLPGNYLLKISRPGYITHYKPIIISSSNVSLSAHHLIAGDVLADGIIDGSDSELLFNSIGKLYGDQGYAFANDLNLDGIIDGSDTELLLANLGKSVNDYGENVNFFE